jgi:hypothetical protein
LKTEKDELLKEKDSEKEILETEKKTLLDEKKNLEDNLSKISDEVSTKFVPGDVSSRLLILRCFVRVAYCFLCKQDQKTKNEKSRMNPSTKLRDDRILSVG